MKVKTYTSIMSLGLLISFFSSESKEILHLDSVKDVNGALSVNFLHKLITLTNAPIFVETGTCTGNTTYNASLFFKTVHTTELKKEFYQSAVSRFVSQKFIHVHLGSSPDILRSLVPQLREPSIFWLDAHYSGGNTARGDSNTPIMEEIAEIAKSGMKNLVILIDDIRLFDKFPDTPIYESIQGYPTVAELKTAIHKISPDYCLVIYGDIALAFASGQEFDVSPVIHACTTSRLFGEDNYSIEEVVASEQIIAQATGQEANALKALPHLFSHSENLYGTGKHYHLWKGLVLGNEGHYIEACQELFRAYELGLRHWRVLQYISDTCYKSGDQNLIDAYSQYLKIAQENT